MGAMPQDVSRAGPQTAAQAGHAAGPISTWLTQLMAKAARRRLSGCSGWPTGAPRPIVSTNKGTKKKKKGGRVTLRKIGRPASARIVDKVNDGGIQFVAVKLRLVRMGKKKQPTYRSWPLTAGRLATVASSRLWAPTPSRRLDRRADAVIKDRQHQAVKWLVNGAQPTERVEKLSRRSGAWDEFHRGEGQVTNLYEAGDINTVDAATRLTTLTMWMTTTSSTGHPVGVLTYLARSLSNDPDAVSIDTEERRADCASTCT